MVDNGTGPLAVESCIFLHSYNQQDIQEASTVLRLKLTQRKMSSTEELIMIKS